MIVKLKVHPLFVLLALGMLVLPGCAPPGAAPTEAARAASAPEDVPTWTPRPAEQTQTALPTATNPVPVSTAETAAPVTTDTPAPPPTPKDVTFSVAGGNLNVRRGPSLNYNYIGVLYDGETALAVGRDRISRWVMIELPSQPGVKGWVTTETKYSTVDGDVSLLPFVEVAPASPAYIRNCTWHTMLVSPNGIELLSKEDKPYNEERFGVGTYWVYDVEDPEWAVIQEINLSEGRTVDILYDWTGEKSKCE